MNQDPKARRLGVGGRGEGERVIWEEGSRSPQPSRLAGEKVWPVPRCPSSKIEGNFSSAPQTLFLRRNKVNLLTYLIPRTFQLFLLSP